ncbi:OsmC family protein [Lactococcus termiticola]|uniref:OsmC/Ohr family protein n=1 Tax=Lactococcus termiticola TaxID=2169526 RepID=A0A2R5HJ07_9LACT|nr:OsmC family protein [Lactococcus termiticola]GBG96111.1 OsmC/Ohr family protein [Lactococcus termiticola]
MKHEFTSSIVHPGGRAGIGELMIGDLSREVSIPAELSGPGMGSNPDDLLLASASTCFTLTLAAMLDASGIEVASMKVDSKLIVDESKMTVRVEKIVHNLDLMLAEDTSDAKLEMAEKLAQRAESNCMITRALAGNVEVELMSMIGR